MFFLAKFYAMAQENSQQKKPHLQFLQSEPLHCSGSSFEGEPEQCYQLEESRQNWVRTHPGT